MQWQLAETHPHASVLSQSEYVLPVNESSVNFIYRTRITRLAIGVSAVANLSDTEKSKEFKGSGKKAKPFSFTLTPDEAQAITEARGQGGQQALHRRLVKQLADGNLTIKLDDKGFGELIRYMTCYGSGGFQSRLKTAFQRVLSELLDLSGA